MAKKKRADPSLAEAVLHELRPSGSGWSRGTCPYCEAEGHRDRKASFGVSPTGFFSCFRCGVKGRVNHETAFFEARPAAAPQEEVAGPPDGFDPIWKRDAWEAECYAPARAYLASRGLDRAAARDNHIGVVMEGRYHHRIIIPVLGLDGGWLGWVGRVWQKKADRPYIYPEGEWRARSLYNHAALRVETEEPAMMVEGCFDAIAVGIERGSALLGKATDWQMDAMAEANRPIAVVMDGDAWRDGMSVAARLNLRGKLAGSVRLPPGADPDEVPPARLQEAARQCLGRFQPVDV